MPSLQVKGGEKLERVAKALIGHEEAGTITRKLRRDIRAGGKEITDEQRKSLTAGLPKRGGINETINSEGRLSVRIALSTKRSVAVDIVDSWKGHDFKAIDKGILRHPLFGHRKYWFNTIVPRYMLTKPVIRGKRKLQGRIIRSLDEVAAEIAKEIR